MTWSKSIHAKYGCAHCRSNVTAQDRDMRQMISNINYQGEPIICEKGRPQGPTPTNHMPSVKLLVHMGIQAVGLAFWILPIPPHPCGASLCSAWYRTAPGWMGVGRLEFKPHLCLLLFLPLSFHLDNWDNTTWVNTVTDGALSQNAGTSGSGFQ